MPALHGESYPGRNTPSVQNWNWIYSRKIQQSSLYILSLLLLVCLLLICSLKIPWLLTKNNNLQKWNHLFFNSDLKKWFYLFIFRERGRVGEKDGEKHQCVVASHMPHTED